MSDINIHILDHKSLIRLNDAIDYCGDSLLNLLPKVDNYFKNQIDAFEQQRDFLKEELDKAEEALKVAERSLSDCENSKRWDDEDKCYRPSCDGEREWVNSAKEYRTDCKDKYDKACRIVSDCKYAYEQEYKHVGGMLTPHGAEKTLEILAKGHTDEANEVLNNIIADVESYLEIPHEELHENEGMTFEKQQKFHEASEQIKNMQQSDSNYHNVVDATVETICAGCHRPIPICACPRTRERIR
jgi:chromosome segregation ATPase